MSGLKNLLRKTPLRGPVVRVNSFFEQRRRKRIYALYDKRIFNLYQTSFKKRALLAYQPVSFHLPPDHPWFTKDTVYERNRLIAEEVHNRGYAVDVIYAYDYGFEPTHEYDLVFDIENVHEKIWERQKKKPHVILHYTTAYTEFNNSQELKRLAALKKRRGVELKPQRATRHVSGKYANQILLIGNEFTRSVFPDEMKKKITLTPNYPLSYLLDYPQHRVAAETRKNFLYMASTGAVLRGADMIVEAIQKMPDCHLYMAGSYSSEKDFMGMYGPIIKSSPNIHEVGWLNLKDEKFKDLAKKCAFHVFASCSEGMPGAVISTMACGMIPIVTKESGMTVVVSGFYVEDNPESIYETMRRCSEMDVVELQKKSDLGYLQVREFKSEFESALRNVLDQVPSK